MVYKWIAKTFQYFITEINQFISRKINRFKQFIEYDLANVFPKNYITASITYKVDA